MARANQIFLHGYLWHWTHRCHKRAFLIGFAKDKQTWSLEDFQQNHEALIRKVLHQPFQRQERCTKALASASRTFVESFAQQARLSPKRRMPETEERFEIREDAPVFEKIAIEDKVLWGNNTFLWNTQESENP